MTWLQTNSDPVYTYCQPSVSKRLAQLCQVDSARDLSRLLELMDSPAFEPRTRIVFANAQENLGLETAMMAAEGLRHVWDTPEEDEAWAHL